MDGILVFKDEPSIRIFTQIILCVEINARVYVATYVCSPEVFVNMGKGMFPKVNKMRTLKKPYFI